MQEREARNVAHGRARLFGAGGCSLLDLKELTQIHSYSVVEVVQVMASVAGAHHLPRLFDAFAQGALTNGEGGTGGEAAGGEAAPRAARRVSQRAIAAASKQFVSKTAFRKIFRRLSDMHWGTLEQQRRRGTAHKRGGMMHAYH